MPQAKPRAEFVNEIMDIQPGKHPRCDSFSEFACRYVCFYGGGGAIGDSFSNKSRPTDRSLTKGRTI